MTERFTGKVSGRNMVSNGIYGMIGKRGRYFVGEAIDKLAEYETAEEEGRLVVLPCKVGDYIWDIGFGRLCAYKITGFSIGNLNDDEDAVSTGSIIRRFAVSDIGKTVFLTEEEAEKALKEMENA